MTPVEITKKAYEYFSSGDIDSLASLWADKLSWTANGKLPHSGHHDNFPDVIENCLVPLAKSWPDAVYTPEDYYLCDNTVFIKGNLVTGGVKSAFVHMCRIENEKLVLFHSFEDTDIMRQTMSE